MTAIRRFDTLTVERGSFRGRETCAMGTKRNCLLFAGCELACLLCFAVLIAPVGGCVSLTETAPVRTWGHCGLFAAALLLGWLAVFLPRRHGWVAALAALLALAAAIYHLERLGALTRYWSTMYDLRAVPDAATAARYGVCLVFGAAAYLGLGIWGIFLRRRSR